MESGVEVVQRQVLLRSEVLKEQIRESLEDLHLMPKALRIVLVLFAANNVLPLQIGESELMAEVIEGGTRIMLSRTSEFKISTISS